jgi:hypothetical protein
VIFSMDWHGLWVKPANASTHSSAWEGQIAAFIGQFMDEHVSKDLGDGIVAHGVGQDISTSFLVTASTTTTMNEMILRHYPLVKIAPIFKMETPHLQFTNKPTPIHLNKILLPNILHPRNPSQAHAKSKLIPNQPQRKLNPLLPFIRQPP